MSNTKKKITKIQIERWLKKQADAQKVINITLEDDELWICNCHNLDMPNRIHILYRFMGKAADILGETIQYEKRDDSDFPYEASFVHNGITAWGLVSEEEYKRDHISEVTV